jgi:hypothetical protein
MPLTNYRQYDLSPDALRYFTNDWSDTYYISGGDTIVTSTWTVAAGLTNESSSHTTTSTTIWIEFTESPAPVIGQQYLVTNHIVTAGGIEDDETIIIVCKQQ